MPGLLFLLLSLLLTGTATANASGDQLSAAGLPPQIPSLSRPIIINHTTCNLSMVPRTAIEQAKSSLHIAYGHTSHGSQIITGMDGLKTFAGAPYGGSLYSWNEDGSNGALQIDDYAMEGDLGNPNRITWANRTRTYLNSHPEVNVIMWSWCGQVSGATEADINLYLSTMSQLEAQYPSVQFVYMTGHLDGTGTNGNLNLRNEQIRAYCRAHNKILYDFADIESYDPDGKGFLAKNANDNCDYSGGNWANQWQNNHTKGVDWYQCYPAHTQALNGNLKAYAAWWMYARLAGWAGPSPTPTPTQYTLDLKRGWNLASIPVSNSSARASRIPASAGVDMVSAYNGTSQTFNTYLTGSSRPDKDILFEPDRGYFFNCTESQTSLTFTGARADGPRTIVLSPGWNLMGWAPAYNSTAKTLGASNTHIAKIARYDAATGRYSTYLPGVSRDLQNFPLSPGNSYFVQSNATTTITIEV